MKASDDGSKNLERIVIILDFLRKRLDANKSLETVTTTYSELSRLTPLLVEASLTKIVCEYIEKGMGDDIRIEFRQGLPVDHTATKGVQLYTEGTIWFFIPHRNKFLEYYEEQNLKLQQVKKRVTFVINQDFEFYPEGAKKRHKFRGGEDNGRYKLLSALAEADGYLDTGILAREIKSTAHGVRKMVDEIRKLVHRKWDLPRDSIFESDNNSGYRVSNISLR